MDEKPERIRGGYILLARQLLKSGIMEMPPLYLKLWVWMLLQASHTEHGSLKRGQFFTSLSKMQKAMSHKVGFMTIAPTIKEIRGFMDFIRRAQMAGTMKGIRGTLVTILNYDYFQNILNYEGHNEGHRRRGALYNKEGINKEGNKENPPEIHFQISELEKRFPDQGIINQAFQAISSTRKSNRIADSVKLSILKSWNQYPVESVMTGVRTYLEKGYADQGKNEKYLLGIIRNLKPEASISSGQAMKSTGSHALDEHYRSQGIRII